MLLTITNTQSPATDLGYLLRTNPARRQSFDLAFGQAHVFYPEASDERCTAALLLDIDPVGLVRNRRGPAGESHALEQYVNDRPYVVSERRHLPGLGQRARGPQQRAPYAHQREPQGLR